MCGICGFVGSGNENDIRKMANAMLHRGPDGEGFFRDETRGLFLGHRRLSVVDIEGGAQPMGTPDENLFVVFNGEIYNHQELRKTLEKKGHLFQSHHSDTEILLHGYREWGPEMVNRLNGMWAFAIYDKANGLLFLSRDRFGKKPLFFTFQKGIFAFASELSALGAHYSIDTNLSENSLKKYFAYGFIPAPSSIFEHIYKLPGGHNLIFNIGNRSIKKWQYWEFIIDPFESVPKNAEKLWPEKILELLGKAVNRRLMADVPLGIFLSGGIDSSSITALASRIAGTGKVETFSIGFRESSFDESEYADFAALQFQTNHHTKIFSIHDAESVIPQILGLMDEPMGDSSILPTYLLCGETRKKVTVALGGDGGDELFAGYDPFHALKMAEFYKTVIPNNVHHAIRVLAGRLPVSHRNMSFGFRISRTLQGISYPKKLWNPVWLGPLEPRELIDFFDCPIDLEDVYSEAISHWDNCPQENMIDRTLQFFTKLYLQDDILVKTDRASMMHSLEIRSPFLDIELVDFIRRIPHWWKYRFGKTKFLLKKAVRSILPGKIIFRPKKGFGVPIGEWFKKNDSLFRENLQAYPINREYFMKKLDEHVQGKKDNRLFLWNYWFLNQIGINRT